MSNRCDMSSRFLICSPNSGITRETPTDSGPDTGLAGASPTGALTVGRRDRDTMQAWPTPASSSRSTCSRRRGSRCSSTGSAQSHVDLHRHDAPLLRVRASHRPRARRRAPGGRADPGAAPRRRRPHPAAVRGGHASRLLAGRRRARRRARRRRARTPAAARRLRHRAPDRRRARRRSVPTDRSRRCAVRRRGRGPLRAAWRRPRSSTSRRSWADASRRSPPAASSS